MCQVFRTGLVLLDHLVDPTENVLDVGLCGEILEILLGSKVFEVLFRSEAL